MDAQFMDKLVARRMLVFFIAFAIVWIAVAAGWTQKVDETIIKAVATSEVGFFTRLRVIVTRLGDTSTIIVLTSTLVLVSLVAGLLTRKPEFWVFFRRFAIPVAIVAAATPIFHNIIKQIQQRPRPEVFRLIAEHGYAFPSGHSSTSLCLYLFAAILLKRLYPDNRLAASARSVLYVLPALIGTSRVLVGVHWPSDVVGGWLLGATLLQAFLWIYPSLF